VTIIFAGSELDVWNPVTANCIESTAIAAAWNSARSRCSIRLGSLSGGTGLGTGLISSQFTPLSNIWFKYWFYFSSPIVSSLPTTTQLEIRNSSALPLFRLNQQANTLNFQAQYWNGSTFVNTGGLFTLPAQSRVMLDLNVNFATGRFDLYLGGVLLTGGSGWAGTAGFTGSFVAVCNLDNGVGGVYVTELILADEDTRGFNVVTVPALAVGALTAWTGTASDINEIVLNDTNSISSGTTGDLESFTIATPSISNIGIRAVAIGFRGSNSGGAPTRVEGLLRLGGTNFFSALVDPGAALVGRSIVFDTNPQTSSRFVIGDITAANLQYGFASRA
jgi:hypothetical protein